MTERELQDALQALTQELIERQDDEDEGSDLADYLAGIDAVATFDDVGLLTGNKGVVLTFADGSEFQLTIVRSR